MSEVTIPSAIDPTTIRPGQWIRIMCPTCQSGKGSWSLWLNQTPGRCPRQSCNTERIIASVKDSVEGE